MVIYGNETNEIIIEEMIESKSKNDQIKVNIDEILRFGSVMERFDIQQQNREAFDWLAENRDEMEINPKNFANHLIAAIGELILSRELSKKVIKKLVNDGIVTADEYDQNFRHFENSSDEPTVMHMSYVLQQNCAYFHSDKR
uniref:Uncharacterized protein n=1 Tax=Onchocerca volvulus TaxID=6282 RepID=A0A8R1TIP6_ONCVO